MQFCRWHAGIAQRCHEPLAPDGLESDWLERFGGLPDERGRWAERQLISEARASMGAPGCVLERALDLPNAVCRFHSV